MYSDQLVFGIRCDEEDTVQKGNVNAMNPENPAIF